MIGPSPTQSNIQAALRSFLLSFLPSGWEVIEGQDNRVSEPSDTNFVVMTPILRERLSTNVVGYADTVFTASASGLILGVAAMEAGAIIPGSQVWAVSGGVPSGTTIVSQIGGTPEGIGSYQLSQAATAPLGTMAAGNVTLLQPTMVTIQLDIHSATVSVSSDIAQSISTVLRDEVATSFFASSGYAVTPLYAGDPKQIPLLNAEQQYETRWVVDAKFQANQVIDWPMQFASQLAITIKPPPL